MGGAGSALGRTMAALDQMTSRGGARFGLLVAAAVVAFFALLRSRPCFSGILGTGDATVFDSRLLHCGGENRAAFGVDTTLAYGSSTLYRQSNWATMPDAEGNFPTDGAPGAFHDGVSYSGAESS